MYISCQSKAGDRTSLQKMVKGERLPGKQFIVDMCSFLKVNKQEEEELLKQYQIVKIGREVYEPRQEIQNLIVGMQKTRRIWLSASENVYKVTQAEEKLPEIRHLELKMDIQDALRMAVNREVENKEQPELYFDMYDSVETVMQQLIKNQGMNTEQIRCHHYIKFYRSQNEGAASIDNIRTLRLVLPFAYTFKSSYEVMYTYVAAKRQDEVFDLWPHYLITSDQCILISADEETITLSIQRYIAMTWQELKSCTDR